MGDETTNIDMAAEREARAAKTEAEMENVRLRRRLMEAEERAERMRKKYEGQLSHSEGLEEALGRRNDEIDTLRTRIKCLEARYEPTGGEWRLIDTWPRFEDWEPVWFGDVVASEVGNITVEAIEFTSNGSHVKDGRDGDWNTSIPVGGLLKRPAPEVLDADGVPIHVGDKVWHDSGCASGVVTSIDAGSLMHTTRYVDERGTEFRDAARNLTHARPDSWERLEEDAVKEACDYFGFKDIVCDVGKECPAYKHGVECDMSKTLDIIRRAKKLAVVE